MLKKILEKNYKLQLKFYIIIYLINYFLSENRPNYDYLRELFSHLLSTSAKTYGLNRDNIKFDYYEDKNEC